MNLYLKHWTKKDTDYEIHDVLGFRFYRHGEKKRYKAWTLDLILAGKGTICLTLTTNGREYYNKKHKHIKDEVDWSLFK